MCSTLITFHVTSFTFYGAGKSARGKDRVHFVESTHGSLSCGWDEGGVVLRLSGEGKKIERLGTIDAKQI